jgi:hypothetical protein
MMTSWPTVLQMEPLFKYFFFDVPGAAMEFRVIWEIDRVGSLKSSTEQPIDNLECLPNGNDSLETFAYRHRHRPAKAAHASTRRQRNTPRHRIAQALEGSRKRIMADGARR